MFPSLRPFFVVLSMALNCYQNPAMIPFWIIVFLCGSICLSGSTGIDPVTEINAIMSFITAGARIHHKASCYFTINWNLLCKKDQHSNSKKYWAVNTLHFLLCWRWRKKCHLLQILINISSVKEIFTSWNLADGGNFLMYF